MSEASLADDPIFAEFRSEARELLDKVRASAREWQPSTVSVESLNEVLRHLHTIKGNAGMFELVNSQSAAHALEAFLIPFKEPDAHLTAADILRVQTEADRIDDLLENFDQPLAEAPSVEADAVSGPAAKSEAPAKPTAAPEEMIRVPLTRVNDALSYTWEIFLLRNQLSYLIENHYSASNDTNYEFLQTWEVIDSAMRRNISELESAAMGMRMRTVSVIYDRVERVSRTYLASSEKRVEIRRQGEDVEVDKQVVDLLAEPMVHLIRNALDHGIESPAERSAAGKPELGTISLATKVDGDQVVISISDDGRGIDVDRVVEKARAAGIDVGHLESEEDALGLIFHSGLSTAEKVTKVSGRGVGTDAVKTAVAEMGGSVRVSSTLGRGATFVIRLPLSMSVLNALLFEVNGALYASSIARVTEVCRVGPGELHVLEDESFFDLRGTFIPCIDIRPAVAGSTKDGSSPGLEDDVSLIVLAREGGHIALRVSHVLQHVELVLKLLPPLAPRPAVVSGYSILHTGQPVFVLDLEALARQMGAAHRFELTEVAVAS